MKQSILAVSLALIAVSPALAQPTGNAGGDAAVIDKVARDGHGEVALGQLAEKKASDAEVKSFAQRLVTDHTKANEQLATVARSEGVTPPTTPDQEQSATRTKLEGLRGSAFDRAFVQAQVEDHQKDIAYLQKEEGTVKNAKLRSFIEQTLPVMQQHLQIAEKIGAQLSGSGTTAPPER